MGPENRTYAWEIEQKLLRRMEQKYEEQRASGSVVEFFENEKTGRSFPMILGGGCRKNRTIEPDGGGVLGVPAGGRNDSPEDFHPPLTNRGVTFHGNEKSETENKELKMGGYDGGVEVGFNGKWDKSKFNKLLEVLSAAKTAAQENDNEGKYFTLENKTFEMKSKTASGYLSYKFVFEGDGVKFYVHNNPDGDIQPVRIRYSAEGLIGVDLFAKHLSILKFLQNIGFKIIDEKISRVDMQVMVFRDMDEFVQAIQGGCYVCTARKWAWYGEGLETGTYRLGSDIQVCIYDKRKELFDHISSEPVKFALMVTECFGDKWLSEDKPVTRIEFRIKRDVLRDMGINTVKDLLENEAGLQRYCCHSWFRLVSEDKREHKGHSHELQVHPLWLEVQGLFETYFPGIEGHQSEVKPVRKRPLICSASSLVKQGIGCFATASALLLGVISPDIVLDTVNSIVSRHSQELVQRTKERAAELGVRAGIPDIDNPATAFIPIDRMIV